MVRTCDAYEVTRCARHNKIHPCTWHFERQRNAQVLLAHAHNACTGRSTQKGITSWQVMHMLHKMQWSTACLASTLRPEKLRRRTGVGPNNEACVVWEQAGEPVRGGLKVALVPR